MSVDFVVLDKDGFPERSVAIGVDLHQKFMSTAASLGLDRLDCFSDYYEDAMVDDNLPELAEQILRLCSQTPPSELLDFLNQLSDLIRHAVANDLPLHCIAD